ncbi:uncharacterized protein LOC135476196 [Liolophura sinensis]|uniref:uncharacterized protein LOC135476196 n=1 Tax=Liolophura sinensis TaxID=3198878 RepID=UPI003158CCDF
MVARDGAFQMRKRVLYIGSAVPLETSEGLDAIQLPLKERYPCHDEHNIQGIDAYLSVLSGGLQLEYIPDPETVVWFPISSLTLCAAVRCIHIVNGATGEKLPKFVSLSNPAALGPNAKKPAIFTAITRRTTGKKVLECHGFVCSSPEDALDLVQAAKNAGFRSRNNRASLYSYVGSPGLPNGRPNAPVLRNESFSSRSSYNTPRSGLRLVPGSPVHGKEELAPEFFEPTPSQGYFYTGGTNHVRSYTLSRVGGDSPQNQPYAASEHAASTLPNRPGRRAFSPAPLQRLSPIGTGQRRIIRSPRMSPPRRFFSPPPPPPPSKRYGYGLLNRGRDPHVFMPPPPIYVDSPYGIPIRAAAGRRGSVSSGESQSRSPSPHPNGEVSVSHDRRRSSSGSSTLRRDGKSHHHHHHHHQHAANGHGATESSSEVSSRPRTPPGDYAFVNRMSRKDRHENQRYKKAYRGNISDDFHTRSVYPEYYFYGYTTDPHHVRLARHQSLPPPMHVSPSRGRRMKKDKSKKKKKKKAKQYRHSDDVSTDSFENRSEIPTTMLDRSYPNIPRDWRRSQFTNERALTKTILGGSRRGYFSDTTPTAYVLNQTREGPHGELGFD